MVATPHEDPCMDSRTIRLNIDRNGNCLEREKEKKKPEKWHIFRPNASLPDVLRFST